MFCPNCGKELNEGEVCTCTQNNGETTVLNNPEPAAEQPVQAPVEAQEQQNYYTPPVQQGYNPEANNIGVFPGAYYDPNQAYSNVQEKTEIPARCDYPEGYKIKRKYVAVLLAASLGMFGIHNFYLGDNNKAIAQLLVATVGGVLTLGVGFAAATIWATVEAVLLLVDKIDRDANGFKIQTFEEAIAAQMKKG